MHARHTLKRHMAPPLEAAPAAPAAVQHPTTSCKYGWLRLPTTAHRCACDDDACVRHCCSCGASLPRPYHSPTLPFNLNPPSLGGSVAPPSVAPTSPTLLPSSPNRRLCSPPLACPPVPLPSLPSSLLSLLPPSLLSLPSTPLPPLAAYAIEGGGRTRRGTEAGAPGRAGETGYVLEQGWQ